MPDFPIVDAHVHLYDPGVVAYGWMRGKPMLDRPHLMAQLDAARGACAIEALVWIEVAADPGQYLQEAAYVEGLARADARIRGLVAHAPLERGVGVRPDLEKLAAHEHVGIGYHAGRRHDLEVRAVHVAVAAAQGHVQRRQEVPRHEVVRSVAAGHETDLAADQFVAGLALVLPGDERLRFGWRRGEASGHDRGAPDRSRGSTSASRKAFESI